MAKDKKNKKTADSVSAPNKFSVPGTSVSYAKDFKKTDKKDKKNKKDKTAAAAPSPQPNLSSLTPEQISQLQIEEAIKESQNPSLKLKKLKSPLSFKGCLLNILIFLILTIITVYIVSYFMVDKFNLWLITKDIFSEFGISQFFSRFFKRIGNLFTGKGWTLDSIVNLFLR